MINNLYWVIIFSVSFCDMKWFLPFFLFDDFQQYITFKFLTLLRRCHCIQFVCELCASVWGFIQRFEL